MFTVPRNDTSQTQRQRRRWKNRARGSRELMSSRLIYSTLIPCQLASVDVFEASDAPQNTTPALSPPIPLDIPRPQNPQTVELHGSVSVRYQSNAGQVSSGVIVGEPLLHTSLSLLAVKADVSSCPLVPRRKPLIREQGLPIACQTKVSPSRTRTSFLQAQDSVGGTRRVTLPATSRTGWSALVDVPNDVGHIVDSSLRLLYRSLHAYPPALS